jgi:hypothetical protein
MDQKLNYFAVIDLAGDHYLFEHVWRWPESTKRSEVPNLVANLIKYAQEIDGGTLRDVDFELKNSQNVTEGHSGSPLTMITKMICTKNGTLVGALFYDLPENTGHDGRDAITKLAAAEHASIVLREAFKCFLETVYPQSAESNAAYERLELSASEDGERMCEGEARSGAIESQLIGTFRARLQTIASQTSSSS